MDSEILVPFFKLTLAALLGLAIGAERTIAGKNAGMRTFALVSLGSALFVVISEQINLQYLGQVNFDPMRISAGIITGVGFIGAGMIFSKDDLLKGLTTAAGLWAIAGIGMAVGFGLYTISIFSTLLVLFIFTALWFLEEKVRVQLLTRK
ncbi:MAG: MgtC/SapB family protein [Minisyncoccia bacterium]